MSPSRPVRASRGVAAPAARRGIRRAAAGPAPASLGSGRSARARAGLGPVVTTESPCPGRSPGRHPGDLNLSPQADPHWHARRRARRRPPRWPGLQWRVVTRTVTQQLACPPVVQPDDRVSFDRTGCWPTGTVTAASPSLATIRWQGPEASSLSPGPPAWHPSHMARAISQGPPADIILGMWQRLGLCDAKVISIPLLEMYYIEKHLT